jgi:hypothetical protein
VTIHSEHGQELKAKLQIRDEDLASMRSVKSKLFYVTDVLAVNIPLVGYAAKRASDIVDLMTEHPNESLPVDEAVAKVKRLHAERERLIADLRGFKRDQYCREILPYELTLSSLYTRALSAESCGDERRSADMRIKLERLGQIRWEQIPQESPDLPDRMSGRHPQFYTWLRLLHRVVDCRNEGIDVDPAPVPAVKGRL